MQHLTYYLFGHVEGVVNVCNSKNDFQFIAIVTVPETNQTIQIIKMKILEIFKTGIKYHCF